MVITDALKHFKRTKTSALAYFYCCQNPAEPGRSDAASIVACIAKQLSTPEYEGPLLDAAIEIYEEKEKKGLVSESLRLKESKGLILRLLSRYRDAVIAIDAIDECDDETRGDLLDTLEDLLKQSPCLLKVFVSSRTDRRSVCRFQSYPSLDLSPSRNATDIALFARFETERLIKRGILIPYSTGKDELCTKVVDGLVTKASGV